MDIFSDEVNLTCKPIISCNLRHENVTLEWYRVLFNETAKSFLSNHKKLLVNAREYGNYSCNVTSGNISVNLTYNLYGKIFL